MFTDNLKALYVAKHPWALFAIQQADRATPPYGDIGQWATIAWVMTGDPKYINPAAAKIAAAVSYTSVPGQLVPDSNFVREYFAELVMLSGWLWPVLTDEQKAPIATGLAAMCRFSCGVDMPAYHGGWRLSDTDQTTGQYLGLLLHDQVFGTTWTQRPDAVLARQAIANYVAAAAGGEWLESDEYDLGTLKMLLDGVYAAGIDKFPEVKAWIPDLVDALLFDLAPGNMAAYQWGDVQEPRSNEGQLRVPLFAMLAGITGDPRLYTAIADLSVGWVPAQLWQMGWRALYLFKPQVVKPLSYLHVSAGNGHVRYKRDGVLFGSHVPSRLYVDHEVPYQSDFQLIIDGQYVLTHPIGYASPAECANTVLFAGLPCMATRGMNPPVETPTGCVVTGGTSGQFYSQPYYYPPPTFVNRHTRTLTYEFPGRVTVRDAFDGMNPQTLPDYARYRATDQATIKAAPALWQQIFHCPVKPTETPTGFTWVAAGGKTVTLTAPANARRLIVDESTLGWGRSVVASEVKWSIRFLSDELTVTLTTILEVK